MKTTLQRYREAVVQAEREPTSENKQLVSNLRKKHTEEMKQKAYGDI